MIVKSKLSHVETDMFYLNHFHWSTSATNELRYGISNKCSLKLILVFYMKLQWTVSYPNLRPSKHLGYL